jgi:TonB family protein
VVAQGIVDEDGCLRQVEILEGSDEKLNAVVLAAFRQWVFQPATLEGQPVSAHYVLTMSFDT